jgi:hypothetical protein
MLSGPRPTAHVATTTLERELGSLRIRSIVTKIVDTMWYAARKTSDEQDMIDRVLCAGELHETRRDVVRLRNTVVHTRRKPVLAMGFSGIFTMDKHC